MKKLGLLSLLLMAVLLTGCLAPSLRVAISPNPIEVVFGDTELKDITVKFSKHGWGSLHVDKLVLVLEDDESKESFGEIEVNQGIPVVPFGSVTKVLDPIKIVDILVDVDELIFTDEQVYDEVLRGESYKLIIHVEGTKPTLGTATVEFK